MKLKKLTQELVAGIVDAGFDKEPKEVQNICIPKIKSGTDLYVIAPEGSGKSTSIVIGVIQQLKEALCDAPRAIVMVASREKAFALEEEFNLIGKHTNLRIFSVFDQGKIQYQKDMIYEGLDILIGTPKRLNELMSITGIPVSELKMLIIDDAESFFVNRQEPVIYRFADGSETAQFIIFANKWIEKFDVLTERTMKNPTIIELN